MNEFSAVLRHSPLFLGIAPQDAENMLRCLGAIARHYPRGEIIFHVGDTLTSMGVVLSGTIRLEKEDYWGNRSILANVESGGIFGEVYVCAPGKVLHVNAIAAAECEILFLDISRILKTCPSACPFHVRLIRNLLQMMASKADLLNRKLEHLSKRTIREKLLSYFSDQAQSAHESSFTIPFNRQELADYLNVERSALSAELSRMQKDGLLTYRKNHFSLHAAQ